MFALRCIGVSLSIFFLTYALLSALLMQSWPLAVRMGRAWAPSRLANLLAVWRLFPLAAAIAITLGYALPSFLLLEPGSAQEPFGPMLMSFGFACVSGVFAGIIRAVMAQQKTSRVVSAWMKGARPMEFAGTVPVMRVPSQSPILTVAGVRSPKILLSEKAANALSDQELHAAIGHEFAHVRRRDNLKKLLFRFAVFPGMGRLESAWSEAAEMAADDAAVDSASEALDLASAIIKLSRFAPVQPCPALTTGLMHSPAAASMTARIERLFHWSRKPADAPRKALFHLLPALAVLYCLVFTYTPVLSGMHEITEWLVR